MTIAAIAAIAAFSPAAQARPNHRTLHHPGCNTRACDKRIDKLWYRLHKPKPRPGPTYEGEATYYSPGECDSTGGGETTAWGTHVYFGEVANSVLPLGTRIWVEPAIHGRHEFRVEDRFGGQEAAGRLDVWVKCGDSIPNPWERFHVIE